MSYISVYCRADWRSPRPLGALGVGGVAAGLVLALLLHLGPALHHVVLHLVHLRLRPALGLVLRAADLLARHLAVLADTRDT